MEAEKLWVVSSSTGRRCSSYVDDAGAVGPDEAGDVLAEEPVFDPHHVLLWDSLRDTHRQRYLGVDGFYDGRRGERRGDVDHRGVGACPLLRLETTGTEQIGAKRQARANPC